MHFLEKWEKGELKPYLRSEPIPPAEEDEFDPVKVLVGANFEEYIETSQPKKDIFVNFYAPWCGHCKRLQPIWKDLAMRLKGNENTVIAKIDATANEIPGV